MNNFQAMESFDAAGANMLNMTDSSSSCSGKCDEEEPTLKRQKTNHTECGRFVSHVNWRKSDVFISYSNEEVTEAKTNKASVRVCRTGLQYGIILNVKK
jgi:hypothetical protein